MVSAKPTQHSVLDIDNTIQTNMDKRLFSCGIFIDLEKDFDSVKKKTLLNKLHHSGSCGAISKINGSHPTNKVKPQTIQIGSFVHCHFCYLD